MTVLPIGFTRLRLWQSIIHGVIAGRITAKEGVIQMRVRLTYLCLLMFLSCGNQQVQAADDGTLASVSKPSFQSQPQPGEGGKSLKKPGEGVLPSASQSKAQVKPSGDPAAGKSVPAQEGTPKQASVPQSETAVPPPAKSTGQLLDEAYQSYQSTQSPQARAAVLNLVKKLLEQSGPKVSVWALSKSVPSLSKMGAKQVDAGLGRVLMFKGLGQQGQAIVQYEDSKQTITYTGRRRRHKKVTLTTSWHFGELELPPDVILQDARILGAQEGHHIAMLAGRDGTSCLWLKAYKQDGSSFIPTASRLDTVPSFLTSHASGRVSFRGEDLVLNIGRVVSAKEGGTTTQLPEAESATYRFWLHLGENGYALMAQLPDQGQFAIVKSFLEAIAQGRTDIAKSLLSDGRLISIPKYVGLHGPYSAFKVAQMASPPSGAPRFRLITGLRDDLIFEVGHLKDRTIVRAIFIAPPDPFLKEISVHIPSYDQVAGYAQLPVEQDSKDTQ